MIDQLGSIGIEKGKPFNPDQKTQNTLKEAVREAHAWLAERYEHSYFPPPYYEGGHWYVPVSHDVIEGLQTFFADPDKYPIDGRGVAYTVGFFSAKHFGAGQFYLMTFTDKTGKGLEGGQYLSTQRAGQSAGHSILVGDRLRSRYPRAHSQHATCQPVVPEPGAAKE